ncbi:putative spermidine/putrescine transport system permease protein [Saccharothrix tamanrassetensis]|uniref:Putative spermidine/putrescine transport system permease protein n=1 Tax=Saccharothrix tamanrassetensis TaxID=1051531 RepID=A0A841CEY7_9PSEU|nr:ABC transporter permease subunit [Saccharothrix tamanrassetensis]MBB5954296.1 putative spermidine/putrescine transport system permease protein [Saccharothrix tamanrassetensis]
MAVRVVRSLVLTLLGVFFLLPLFAMAEFSTRGANGTRSLESWSGIVSDRDLVEAILASVQLAATSSLVVLVLLVPTMAWIRLRLPKLRRLVEFLCLLPITIPAIVLVVGMAPLYAWVSYFLGDSPLTLTFAYAVLVLPFAYRAIDAGLSAIDLKTLAEAARSLGASWGTVLLRIVVPNIRTALIGASLLSVALVLGEFTIASLLNFDTLQVRVNLLGKRNAGVSIAVSLLSLLFAFVLLFLLSFVGRRRRDTVAEEG